jgi:membrane protein YdbS with pleckstrin-like domain
LEWFAIRLSSVHFVLNVLYGAVVLYIVLTWVYDYFLVRSDAIVVRNGILFSSEELYQMEDIKTITVQQGFWGKLFNIGAIRFYAHQADREVILHSVDAPNKVAAHIHSLHPAPATVQMKINSKSK